VQGGPALVKLADFGVSVVARGDDEALKKGRVISPLVALLTGEQEDTASSLVNGSLDEGQNSPAALAGVGSAGRGDDLTEMGMIVGTPMYMAPEMAFGSRHAQASSDVFALGVIAYEVLTRELPWKTPPVGAALRRQPLVVPSGLRQLPALEPALTALFERALAMEPAQRPTATELAAALAGPRPVESEDPL
jgi:serine/threonine protein kinase